MVHAFLAIGGISQGADNTLEVQGSSKEAGSGVGGSGGSVEACSIVVVWFGDVNNVS